MSKKLSLIGDVHGKFQRYKTIIRNFPDTIQVGDMGVGFRDYRGREFTNPPHYAMVQENARFIRGNHDNPSVCRRHSQCIDDGTVEDGVMFVGGAFSIDKQWRYESYDWWPDEELNHEEMLWILDIYTKAKPQVMVTHDGPEFMLPYYLSHHLGISTRTGQFFDRLFEIHQPKIWVHGHHHFSFDHVIKETRFVVLAELEHKIIEIE